MADTTIDIKAKDKVSPVLKKITLEMSGFKRQIDSFAGGFNKMLAVGSGVGAASTLYNIGKASLDASIELDRLDKAYQTITGSSHAAAEQQEFLYQTTKKLGLEYLTTAESAKTLYAAARGTNISGEINSIVEGVGAAATSLSLSQQQVERVFVALGQMMSKGKVQAEEMRQQLGEQLPGAFQLAAKAMGMSTAELDKFMADGKLLAEDFLPRFGRALRDEFGASAEKAAEGAQQAINRMSTEWTLFKANVTDSGPVIAMIRKITAALEQQNAVTKKRREEDLTDTQMRAARIIPEGLEVDYDSWGGGSTRAVYTEKQREKFRQGRKEIAEYSKALNDASKEAENVLSKGRTAVNNYLKKSQRIQQDNLKKEYEDTLSAINASIEVYKRQGVDYSKLLNDRIAVTTEYNRKREKLEKQFKAPKTAGQKVAEKTQKTVDSFRSETEQLLAEVASLRESLDAAGGSLDKTEMEAAKAEAALAKKQASSKWQTVARENPLEYERRVAAERDKIKLQSRQRDEQINKDFLEDARKTLTSHYDLERAALEEEYRLYSKHVTDRALLDQWYARRQEELARDPISGMKRAWRDYYADATDYATGFEQVATQGLNGVSSTLTSVLWKGEQDFASFFQSIGQMLTELALKASVAQIGGGLAGLLGDLFSSSITLPGFTSADLNTSSWGGAKVKHGGGMGWESSFYRPVPRMLFARAPRFHKGRYYDPATELPAIIRKDESVLTPGQMRAIAAAPVPRVLPVDTGRNTARNAAPVVNITVINQAGAEVETNQRHNSDGGIDLKIMMLKEVARDTARRGGYTNKVLRNQFGASKKPIKY